MSWRTNLGPFDGHVAADGRAFHFYEVGDNEVGFSAELEARHREHDRLRAAGYTLIQQGVRLASDAAMLRLEGAWIAGAWLHDTHTLNSVNLSMIASGPQADELLRLALTRSSRPDAPGSQRETAAEVSKTPARKKAAKK